ncbi:ABC transporter ATP-binding protein [Streptomyces sp. NPDC051105]|uniref:ABC transporter ATP-binding protein n=1 Tax=Streptomyces sp. NPDC051105 TaxID=3154843 RepID=UPI0034457E19
MTDLRESPSGHTTESAAPALEAVGLGRRYKRGWALRDCSFRLPAGRICALVGPNGAGKTTLLSLAAGLLEPSTGTVRLGGHPARSAEARRHTAFLSQEKALYPRFRVSEILRMGRELNPTWHQETAERIISAGNVPMDARVGTLSGGQRTRVAFALALGKRPRLLLLDEPMADLDPLVRRQMMDTLMAEAVQHGSTVVMSSHLVSELEGVCDFLVLIGSGTVRLAGDVDELIRAHRMVSGPDTEAERLANLPGQVTVESRSAGGRTTALIRPRGPLPAETEPTLPSLEELLLAHLRTDDAAPLITSTARPGSRHEVTA